jgi:hypothetical protein
MKKLSIVQMEEVMGGEPIYCSLLRQAGSEAMGAFDIKAAFDIFKLHAGICPSN